MKLVEKGWTREKAYDTVQPQAIKAWENNLSFRALMESVPEVVEALTNEEIDECFDTSYHIRRIDEIYRRAGIL